MIWPEEREKKAMKRTLTHIVFLALLAGFALPGTAQGRPSGKQDKKEKKVAPAQTPDPPAAVRPATEDPAYVIGEEDSLAINVWKEPELSRAVPVRPDGKISLPLLNDVQAAGLTPLQLGASITEKLRKYVADPQVTVIVTAIQSRRFYILGEVGHSGSFPLLHGMTVLQALSDSGSFTQYANVRKIYVLRNENGKQIKYPFNYREVIKGKNQEQNIELRPGDTIVVP